MILRYEDSSSNIKYRVCIHSSHDYVPSKPAEVPALLLEGFRVGDLPWRWKARMFKEKSECT